MDEKPIVLILCTGNSCRSQMAEAFLRKYQGARFNVSSAGTEPKAQVHPLAVSVMGELGIDISGQQTKNASEFLGKIRVRHLLIVCDHANMNCPRAWPGAYSRNFLPFDDPAAFVGSAAQTLAEFRRIRDQIDEAMRHWEPQS